MFCPQRKKRLAEKLLHQYKFVVKSEEESYKDEEDEKLECADTDLDVECADTGSEEAHAETEEGMACAETDTAETSEADTGVTPDTSNSAAAVEPPARREKGRMGHRPLPIAADCRNVRRPTRRKRFNDFSSGGSTGQMIQANEMRGKYVATEGVVFHPEDTLALGDSEWTIWRVRLTKQSRGTSLWKPPRFWKELKRALKGDGTRWKRGLLNEGGQLLNWLFGTATTKNLESVYSRIESFNKKGLEVVHLLQEQVTLLKATMGHLVEHESEIRALMAVPGQSVTLPAEDAAIGRLSLLLRPTNVLAQALDLVRQALHQGWGLTTALQGGNGWRAYQECVSYAGSHQKTGVDIPFVRGIGSIPGGITRSVAVRRVQLGRSPEICSLHAQCVPILKAD
ncbi:Uncharacterized protein APZ42_028899 [Daphnia magna]|uniref:Uncharacterized protein n=1 Tax=Daphnia magna TaxID=35525 RepID=A0A164Q1P4_9CRUS|nr:Uncharacterized protein APZ42_028899 [Daphnia magna]